MELPRNSVIEKQTNDKITILNSRIVRSTVQVFPKIPDGNIQILQTKNKDNNLRMANAQVSVHDSVERTNILSFEIASLFCSNFKSIENPQANSTYKSDINFLQTCIDPSKIAQTSEISPNNGTQYSNNNRVLNLDSGIVSNDSRRESNVIGRVFNDNLKDLYVPIAGNVTERVSNVIERVLNDNGRVSHGNDTQKVLNNNFRLVVPMSTDTCLADDFANISRISSSNCIRGSFGLSDINDCNERKRGSIDIERVSVDNNRVSNTIGRGSNYNRVPLNNSERGVNCTQEVENQPQVADNPSERAQNHSHGVYTAESVQNRTQEAHFSA